jgi:cholesterol transport system auxiliary component
MRWLVSATTLLLLGCTGNTVQRADVTRFDFGPRTVSPVADTGISGVDVVTPSWLSGSTMQYRLLYFEAARRLDYAESGWVAPPAELLKQSLKHRLAVGVGRCRMRIELDEFIQIFDSPQSSRFLMEGRATLFADQSVVAGRAFNLARPASTADAKGGVAAASVADMALGDELTVWASGYLDRCRAS